jgi:hypothetical protein
MGRHQADAYKPRGVPRVDDRRVLNGIFWVCVPNLANDVRSDDRHQSSLVTSQWNFSTLLLGS